MLRDLITNRIFQKTEGGQVPKVWVRPGFYILDFDQKQTFLGVVYAYYSVENPTLVVVSIRDAMTNKEIGTFDPERGLKLK